jgi:DNA-directed RNA polymerase subunit RPC12/RpoP
MGEKKSDEEISVTCPECGAKVKLAVKDAEEKMSARCPKGHEIPLMKAL